MLTPEEVARDNERKEQKGVRVRENIAPFSTNIRYNFHVSVDNTASMRVFAESTFTRKSNCCLHRHFTLLTHVLEASKENAFIQGQFDLFQEVARVLHYTFTRIGCHADIARIWAARTKMFVKYDDQHEMIDEHIHAESLKVDRDGKLNGKYVEFDNPDWSFVKSFRKFLCDFTEIHVRCQSTRALSADALYSTLNIRKLAEKNYGSALVNNFAKELRWKINETMYGDCLSRRQLQRV